MSRLFKLILVDMYLKQVKDISSIQTVVTQPVQQFHLSASREILKGGPSKWVGLPFFQFPPVADDVVQVTAKCLWAKEYSKRNRREMESEKCRLYKFVRVVDVPLYSFNYLFLSKCFTIMKSH